MDISGYTNKISISHRIGHHGNKWYINIYNQIII